MIKIYQVDFSQSAEVGAAVSAAVALFRGLDIIVNAVAIHPFGTALQTENRDLEFLPAGQPNSHFLFDHFGISEMKKRGRGTMVNLASIQEHAWRDGVDAYATSKGAIPSLTPALAVDHARDGVCVNSIRPGSVRTLMLEDAARGFSRDLPLKQVLDRVAMLTQSAVLARLRRWWNSPHFSRPTGRASALAETM